MGVGNGSTMHLVMSRVALVGGTAAVAGAMAFAGAGTASAAPWHHHGIFHVFGGVGHAQKHAEHQLGISGSQNESRGARTNSSVGHPVAKATVSAEHHVGRIGSTNG
jgi:hypothetical protein